MLKCLLWRDEDRDRTGLFQHGAAPLCFNVEWLICIFHLFFCKRHSIPITFMYKLSYNYTYILYFKNNLWYNIIFGQILNEAAGLKGYFYTHCPSWCTINV